MHSIVNHQGKGSESSRPLGSAIVAYLCIDFDGDLDSVSHFEVDLDLNIDLETGRHPACGHYIQPSIPGFAKREVVR